MPARLIFITGTDTGVGKTVLTRYILWHLLDTGHRAVALKPVSSGGREDAGLLYEALGGEVPIDVINPWHYGAPVAPLLAAHSERRRVRLAEVVRHIQTIAMNADTVLVEGAGGLLSPLGEDFDSRELIRSLRAPAIVVCPNRLGAVNQARLVLEALPASTRHRATVVLMNPQVADAATRANPGLLALFTTPGQVLTFPWSPSAKPAGIRPARACRIALATLTARLTACG